MTRRWFIILTIALLTGCSEKDKPEEKPSAVPKDAVQLSDESLKLITLEIVPVAPGKLELTLPAPGRVSFNLNRTAKVTATFEGRIAKMNVDVGAPVHEGDVMALIDSPEFLNKPLELKAPITGQVIERRGAVGEIIDRGTDVYTISDPSHVWVIASVSAADVAAVRVDQPATIRTAAYPDETFAGRIVLVSPEVDEKTRTVEVRIETESPKLKPGMFADVEIVTGTAEHVLMIPDDAIQRIDEQEIVFVATDPHTFTKRIVKTGRRQSGKVEIVDGLKEGERVVTKGSFLLKSELLKSEFGE
jgi:multidrug efflux pump subunit AcrA (membrane-fusion protein)